MRGPVPRKLVLTVEHLRVLQRHLRTGTTEHRVACRSRILLLRAEGYGPTCVAEKVGQDRASF